MISLQQAADIDIRRLQASYVFHTDRGRTAESVGLFIPDGILRIVGGAYDGESVRGAPAISLYLTAVARDFEAVGMTESHRHHVSPAHIEFTDSGAARAESSFQAMRASGPDHWGVYRDRLVLESGRWLFAERIVRVEGTDAESWHHRVSSLRDRGRAR